MSKAKLKSKTTSNRPAQRRLRVERVVRARLYRLKIGETTKYGDWCCNERDKAQPVEITGGSWTITEQHHPVYRIIAP